MDSHNQRILSIFEVLNQFLGKEIYTFCIHHPFVVRGYFSRFEFEKLILFNETGEHIVYNNNIASIQLINPNDEIYSIESNMKSDSNNKFFIFLNQYILCLSIESHWAYWGILEYIGSDYITIFNEDDNKRSRIPLSEVKDIATNWSRLPK